MFSVKGDRRTGRGKRTKAFAVTALVATLLTTTGGISAGAQPPDPNVQGGNLVIWATDSVKIERGATVNSNGLLSDIVAQNPFVSGDQSVRMLRNASTDANTRVIGDNVRLDNNSSAGGDVYYNTLSGNGAIDGLEFTPLAVPVTIDDAPAFRTGTPGGTDVNVARNGSQTITPGAYRDIMVNRNGTLVLDGAGDYEVRSISLDRGASVEIDAGDDVEILVKRRFEASPNVSFGPQVSSGLAPDNIAVYVEGATDTTEVSGRIGNGNTFEATMYVRMSGPELVVGNGTTVTGALFGTRVKVDENTIVNAASFFGGADLSITKTDSVDPVVSGEQLTYTVTVSNAGPQDATNVVVTDTLPAEVSNASTTGCNPDPGLPNCNLDTIAAGGSKQYTITVDVDAGLNNVTITNTASVTSDRFDPVPGNNSVAEDTLVLEPTADLSIAKSDDVDPVVAGDTVIYTVTVDNAGPQAAPNVVVTDTLPAGVTLVATTGCAEDPVGVPTCSLGTIASGGNASYTIEVTVDATVVGTLTNTASVVSDITDPDTGNNSTTEDTEALPVADLSISKSDDVDPVVAGDTVVYTVTVDNAGPQTATNVVVTDTLPAGVTLVETVGCAEDPVGVPTCSLGNILSGGSDSYTIEVTVDAGVAGTLTNGASVSSDTFDPDTGNNSTTEDTVADPTADLSMTKVDNVDPVFPGDTVVYTVTVNNAGPQAAVNVVVTDTLPAGVTLVETVGCGEDPTGVPTCSLGTIASGGSAQYTIEVTVDAGTSGTITNNASVTSDTFDPDGGNNSTSEVTFVATPTADLDITKSDDADPVFPGDTVVYTVTVDNAGPQAATNVVVSDTLPAGVTLVTTTGCAEDPVGVPTCSLGSIASGGSAQYTIEVTVDAGTSGTITNNASVTSDIFDNDGGNNSTTEDTLVDTPEADLSITKTDDVDPNVVGGTLVYTVTVSNAGPQAASNVVVTDTLPAGVTLVETVGCAEDPVGVPTCSLGTIASSGSAFYTIEVTIDSGTSGTITNNASVTSATFDPAAGNNSTTEDTTVAAPPTAVDDAAAAASSPGDDHHTALNSTLTVVDGSSEDILLNDDLGFPAAALVSFGGGDLGGSVTDNAAGATVAVGAGSLTVNADGTYVFTPDTNFTGLFSFDYRISNTAGSDDGTVTIAVGVRPTATNDSRDAVGNVGLDTSTGTPFSVLTNDTGDQIAVTAMDATSANGGAVSHLGGGQFTYDPAPGFEGTDTFGYTMANGFGPDSGTVTVTVTDVIWFIDNSAGGPGDGTVTDPYSTLAGFNGGAADDPGDVIFFEETSSGNYTGGITLLNGQIVVGNGATASIDAVAGIPLPPNSRALPATFGARPTIAEPGGGNGITLASGNTIRGLDVSNSGGGAGISGSSVGTLTVDELGVSSTGGPALDIDNGVMDLTIDSVSVSSSSTGGIDLTSVGGTMNLSGIDLTTTGGTGMNVTGGGTLNVTGTGNSVDSTNGPAVVLESVTIGGFGVTYLSLSSSSGSQGIRLTDTGAGAFTVTGIGSTDGSGGTLSNITGDGVRLENTAGPVTLNNMTFTDIGSTGGGFDTRSGHDAIHGEDVLGGLSVDNATVDNISDNFINGALHSNGLDFTSFVGLSVTNSDISDTNRFHVSGVADDQDEGAIRIRGLSGTATITGNDFDRGGEFLDLFTASSGTLGLTVTNNFFDDAYKEFSTGGTVSKGVMCVDLTTRGSLSATATVTGNEFTNCKIASLRIVSEGPTVSGTVSATVTGNMFEVTDHSSEQGLSGDFPQGGVNLRHIGTGTYDAVVENNDFGGWNGTDTTNWVMNADGGVGALTILAEGGTMQVEATLNEFNSPINAPFFVRADGSGTDAEIYFHQNTYRSRTGFFSPDPFFGTFTAPGLAHETISQNSAVLDWVMENEAISVHDASFDFRDTLQLRTQTSGTACGSFTNVTTALAGANGDIRLNNVSGTLNRHDGGGNDPFDTSGTIGTVGSCTKPSGTLF